MFEIPNGKEDSLSTCFYKQIMSYLSRSKNGFNGKIGLAITFSFNSDRNKESCGTTTGSVNNKWGNINYFYNRTCRIISRFYNGRKDLKQKPLVYASIEPLDNKLADEIRGLNGLHIHTLWILDANYEQVIEEVRNYVLNMDQTNFLSIFIQKVKFDENDTGNIWGILDYNLKFDRLLQIDAKIGESMDIYPKEIMLEF